MSSGGFFPVESSGGEGYGGESFYGGIIMGEGNFP